MTFTLEVFEIIQSVITLKNNKAKRVLKAKISENLESEIRDSIVPSYYFSVLTAMMDVEVPDEDIEQLQTLLRPICRKYTIQNIPTYLADLFLEDDELEGVSSQGLKEKLTDIFSTKDLITEETSAICDYCCTAMGIVASSMDISYNKDSFEDKVGSILFNTINCEENDSDEDNLEEDDSDEEFLQVLETGDMIDMENGEVFKEKDIEDYTHSDEDYTHSDEDYTDSDEDYTDSDEDLYEELEEKQMEINLLRKKIENLQEENKRLHNSINKIESIYIESQKNQKRVKEQRIDNTNLIVFGIVFGSIYIFGPSYFYMRTKPDMISMSI